MQRPLEDDIRDYLYCESCYIKMLLIWMKQTRSLDSLKLKLLGWDSPVVLSSMLNTWHPCSLIACCAEKWKLCYFTHHFLWHTCTVQQHLKSLHFCNKPAPSGIKHACKQSRGIWFQTWFPFLTVAITIFLPWYLKMAGWTSPQASQCHALFISGFDSALCSTWSPDTQTADTRGDVSRGKNKPAQRQTDSRLLFPFFTNSVVVFLLLLLSEFSLFCCFFLSSRNQYGFLPAALSLLHLSHVDMYWQRSNT